MIRRHTARVPLLVAMGLSAIALGCEKKDDAEPAIRSVPIAVQDGGTDPALTSPQRVLARTPTELAQLGSPRLNNLPVDFSQQSVVLIALGEKPTAGYRVSIDRVRRQGDTLLIDATVSSPPADAMTAQVITYPYAAAVVPVVSATDAKWTVNER